VIFVVIRAFPACPRVMNYSFPDRRLLPCGTAHCQPWLAAAESVFNFPTSRTKEEITKLNSGREHCRANNQGQELLTFPLPSEICSPISVLPAEHHTDKERQLQTCIRGKVQEKLQSVPVLKRRPCVGYNQIEALSSRSFW